MENVTVKKGNTCLVYINRRYLSLKEAALYLAISERTLRRRVYERSIKHYYLNGRYFFIEQDLIDYMDSGRVLTMDEQVQEFRLSQYA
ncbi:helix-turn-helix domain-containing protein [Telluribacter sp. SYSU D00476]|uniref:helix-turn-helix domain-containing protein n=1 Tax=Telluribacter sp. SYSU D00476 TaxID=2811430 RepID=UPI0038F66221